MEVCPWCGGHLEYFSDDDNSNYNEYICENYNRGQGKTCWWRESSGVKPIEHTEFTKKLAKIETSKIKAYAMIAKGKEILDDIEHGRLK